MKIKSILAAVVVGLASLGASASVNLVTNGDFETGTFAGWTNWTTPSNAIFSQVILTSGDSHGYVWRDGSVGTTMGTISQDIATVAGGSYTLSFDFKGTEIPNKVKVWFGEDLVPFAQTNFNYQNWTHFTITGLVADANHSLLKFGSRNDPDFNSFDNITLTGPVAAVPEPESFAMMLAGLGLMGAIARRRTKKETA